jgi:predicted kinase
VSGVRRLVYVSGSPGAGKTSLAGPLAAELGYALLTKDLIKETLHDALGAPEPNLAWSRKLGGAAMELLWTLAARSADVLIEANFRPHSDYERAKLSALGGHPVEVHCACPAELAASRYNTRARHPVHHLTHASVGALAEWDVPVGIGTLITVDTTIPVDIAVVAAQVRRHHAPR